MRRQRRRIKREPAALDITAFLNLIVVLVPFLLITVVLSDLKVLELNLPGPAGAAGGPAVVKRDLQLEIIIRPGALHVGDRNRGPIQRIANTDKGYDYQALSALMQQLKARFPQKLEATILSDPDTRYGTLVQVMDAVRAVPGGQNGSVARELFPEISVGDAPPARAAERP